MRYLPIILFFVLSFTAVNSDGQVIITFNASKEVRQFAKDGDTINVEFKPVKKEKNSTYRFRNLIITYEGISNTKDKLVHADTLISNMISLSKPVIKIPLRKYFQDKNNGGRRVYIDIEAVDKIYDGRSETLQDIPKSQLHRNFLWND